MIVLDTSAAVAVLLNLGEAAMLVGNRMNALRRSKPGASSREREAEFIEDLTSMRPTRYHHTALLSRIWELRNNITAYDAAYVALAETLDAPRVTLDAKLSRAPGIRTAVELYE